MMLTRKKLTDIRAGMRARDKDMPPWKMTSGITTQKIVY